jgi:hypothetical protein
MGMAGHEPSGRDSDEDSTRTHLVKPFHQVLAELDDRTTRGRELRAQLDHSERPIPARLDEFGAKYWDWHDANATFLEGAFSTSELLKSYLDVRIEKVGDPSGYADLLRDLALHLSRDIVFLVSLRDRLRAYVAPTRQ